MKFLASYFQLLEHGTTLRREVIAGMTTFAAMAYILAVNPAILSGAGMDTGALVTATALASALMTTLMALRTNYPIALAPGMGLNAVFTFTICRLNHISWQAALGLVFYGGVLFFALSVSGVRKRLVDALPREFKIAISCGVGMFISFIGLKNGGIVVASPDTLVTLGHLNTPEPLLVLLGIITTAIGVARNLPGAVILNIAFISLCDLLLRATHWIDQPLRLPSSPIGWPASLAPSFLRLDLGWFWHHLGLALPLLFTLLLVDLFDNMGTLLGVCQRAGLLDEKGNLPRLPQAFSADAAAAMIGACLGTSTVTSFIESAAGVEAGGRTGLTALTTAGCFLLSLIFTPLILLIPDVATAPALVVIGIFMLQGVAELNLKDFASAAPSLLAIMIMPLTFSITEGIAFGILADLGLKLGLGRWREIRAMTIFLGALFLLHYLQPGALIETLARLFHSRS